MEKRWQEIKELYQKSRGLRIALWSAVTVLFMKYLLLLFLPFLFGLLLAKRWGPHLLRHYGTGRKTLRMVMAFLLLLFWIAIPLGLIVILMRELLGCISLKEISESVSGFACECDVWLSGCCNHLGKGFGIQGRVVHEKALGVCQEMLQRVRLRIGPFFLACSGAVLRFVAGMGILWAVFLVFFLMLIKDYREIAEKFQRLRGADRIRRVYDNSVKLIGGYFKAQLVILSIVGSLCSLTFYLIGMQMPLLWGYLTGILDMLPFIGTGTVLIPMAIYRVAILKQGVRAFILLLLYAGCYLLREFIEPRLVGGRMGIHPIWMLLAIYFGVRFYGLAGILTGPLTLLLVRELSGNDEARENRKE